MRTGSDSGRLRRSSCSCHCVNGCIPATAACSVERRELRAPVRRAGARAGSALRRRARAGRCAARSPSRASRCSCGRRARPSSRDITASAREASDQSLGSSSITSSSTPTVHGVTPAGAQSDHRRVPGSAARAAAPGSGGSTAGGVRRSPSGARSAGSSVSDCVGTGVLRFLRVSRPRACAPPPARGARTARAARVPRSASPRATARRARAARPRPVLDRLDHAVLRPRDRTQTGAEPLDRLVVKRVHVHRAAAGRLRETAVGRDLHLVRRAIARLDLAMLDRCRRRSRAGAGSGCRRARRSAPARPGRCRGSAARGGPPAGRAATSKTSTSWSIGPSSGCGSAP